MGYAQDMITDHAFTGFNANSCHHRYPPGYWNDQTDVEVICGGRSSQHADPGDAEARSLIVTSPHVYLNNNPVDKSYCAFTVGEGLELHTCGQPESEHTYARRALPVRVADVQQYERAPMPEEARGRISVRLVDGPVDPLGTLAVVCGIYEGKVYRSKAEVTDDQRREAWAAMGKTVLSGPLETMQLTFLLEGVDRALTHQIVRSRFSFFAQESLRFAVPEDWASEVALPPSLLGRKEDDPLVAIWRRGLNQTEDTYAALVSAGMPAEEARGQLPHAIPTRMFWTMSVRTLVLEAGKRTCTQAQFPWRTLMAGIRGALLARAAKAPQGGTYVRPTRMGNNGPTFDGWQYELLADVIKPVCYQTGRCGFKAEFDRACSIRERVDRYEAAGVPSSEWGVGYTGASAYGDVDAIPPIKTEEWLADPSAARVRGGA